MWEQTLHLYRETDLGTPASQSYSSEYSLNSDRLMASKYRTPFHMSHSIRTCLVVVGKSCSSSLHRLDSDQLAALDRPPIAQIVKVKAFDSAVILGFSRVNYNKIEASESTVVASEWKYRPVIVHFRPKKDAIIDRSQAYLENEAQPPHQSIRILFPAVLLYELDTWGQT